MFKLPVILVLVVFFSIQCLGQDTTSKPAPKTIAELEAAIKDVLAKTGAPGAGVALVNQQGPVWIAGIGKADVENNKPADENTMYRIGSISKMFVALAILKLQEEGKLSLKDKVRQLVPEIKFTNRWEKTSPILVEHLLEHTTGWEDLHLPESAFNDPRPISTKESLDFHPDTRTSRWVPGTRFSYSNSGPPVAAYIVEKLTGQTFEDYVKRHFFDSLGMKTATFFLSDDYKKHGAKFYRDGVSLPYMHMLFRPSGSINASLKDMTRLLQFFINRGTTDSARLISEASLQRMETPATTLGAKAGVKLGYALANSSSQYKDFVYRTHGGAVRGGLSSLAYLPEHNLGYIVIINSIHKEALHQVAELIRAFQTKDLPPAKVAWQVSKQKAPPFPSGYYVPISPRSDRFAFFERLIPLRIWQEGDTVYFKDWFNRGEPQKFIYASGKLYQSEKTGRVVMARVTDPLAGEALEIVFGGGSITFERTSALVVYGTLVLLAIWFLFMMRAFILAPIWLIRLALKKIPGGAPVLVRLWPLLAGGFLFGAPFTMAIGARISNEQLAYPTFISVSVMVLTIAFALMALWSVIAVFRYRHTPIKKGIYWPAAILSVLHVLLAVYLLANGVIGIRLWA